MTHVLQVGGNSDGVILKQVLGLREKTWSGLRRQEETNYGDPERGGGDPERGGGDLERGGGDPERRGRGFNHASDEATNGD